MTTPGSLTPHPNNDQFHIVMVEPADSLNIGSVARAMRNLGFKNLHLVNPINYDPQRATITACWAADLLAEIKIHKTLSDAIAPMEDVVGFSTREGRNRSSHMTFPDWLAVELPTPPRRTALLFGPEDNGLRQEHTDQCRCLVRIPSTPNCPAFNLAQSVLIGLYELSKRTWSDSIEPRDKTLPTWNDFYQLDRIVEEVCLRTGYYRDGTPEPIPYLVRSMLRRINPDDREMRILMGLFARVNRTLDHLEGKKSSAEG